MSGRGNRRDNSLPKGRQLDESSVIEVQSLLGSDERRKDLLIEYLHRIQDKYGCLEARHICALASELRLSQVEVYEVASFYDHFDVIKEGEDCPPPHTIRVCDSISCQLGGCESLLKDLESKADSSQIRILRAPCMGGCDVAPAARVGNKEVGNADADTLLSLIATNDLTPNAPSYKNLDTYKQDGGYQTYERVKSGELDAESVLSILSDAGLRGLGGAGFPTGQKWRFVRDYPGSSLHDDQRRRGRAGHIQRPLLPRARPPFDVRGCVNRRSHSRSGSLLHIYAR